MTKSTVLDKIICLTFKDLAKCFLMMKKRTTLKKLVNIFRKFTKKLFLLKNKFYDFLHDFFFVFFLMTKNRSFLFLFSTSKSSERNILISDFGVLNVFLEFFDIFAGFHKKWKNRKIRKKLSNSFFFWKRFFSLVIKSTKKQICTAVQPLCSFLTSTYSTDFFRH